MAKGSSQVHIHVTPTKEKKSQPKPTNNAEEEKEFLIKETIVISSEDNHSYELELTKGDHLKGEILSSEKIDICFLKEENFESFEEDTDFLAEYCHEAVLETELDYFVPHTGTWFLVLINDYPDRSAKVKVRLH